MMIIRAAPNGLVPTQNAPPQLAVTGTSAGSNSEGNKD